jgi:hypothetical protein
MTEMPAETTRPTIGALAKALAAFQGEMPTVPKKHTAQVKSDKGSYSYTYAGLADVTEAAMPLLSKHGLAFVTLPQQGQLVGMLLHESGESLSAALPITGGTPQQIGSSLTYMRRYLFGCVTGVVTDDDDDGRGATAQSKPRAAKRAAPSEPREPVEDPWAKPNDGPAGISPAQTRLMGALMRTAGLPDRDSALAYVNDVIGRTVESRSDLTSQEASKVIDALQQETKDQNGGDPA